MHILPEAYESKLLTTQAVSLTFISAIVVFIFIERVMDRVGVSHQHWQEEDNSTESEPSAITEKRQLQEEKGKAMP